MKMICSFLRAVQYTEKLHGSSGKRLFLPRFVLSKAFLKTEPKWTWGLHKQKTVRPGCVLGVSPRTVWTQGRGLQRAKEDGSKQVSVHSQRAETVVSTAQKGKREFSSKDQPFSKYDERCPCAFIEVRR